MPIGVLSSYADHHWPAPMDELIMASSEAA